MAGPTPKLYEYEGQMLTAVEIAKESGLGLTTVYGLIKNGIPITKDYVPHHAKMNLYNVYDKDTGELVHKNVEGLQALLKITGYKNITSLSNAVRNNHTVAGFIIEESADEETINLNWTEVCNRVKEAAKLNHVDLSKIRIGIGRR